MVDGTSDPSGWEESSCLKFMLDKRDASLGPWIPGRYFLSFGLYYHLEKSVLFCIFESWWTFLANRDSFEDELRAFDGGVDGFLPCVWDDEISNFPQVAVFLYVGWEMVPLPQANSELARTGSRQFTFSV